MFFEGKQIKQLRTDIQSIVLGTICAIYNAAHFSVGNHIVALFATLLIPHHMMSHKTHGHVLSVIHLFERAFFS